MRCCAKVWLILLVLVQLFFKRYLRGLALGLRVVESVCPKAPMHLAESWSVISPLQSRAVGASTQLSTATRKRKREQRCQAGNPRQLQSIAALPVSASRSKLRAGGLGNCSPCSVFQ